MLQLMRMRGEVHDDCWEVFGNGTECCCCQPGISCCGGWRICHVAVCEVLAMVAAVQVLACSSKLPSEL
jgi:hypothetical protein